ncbi:histidine utilization repressor [Rhizobium sp. CC-YZS058]|uniref:histidine utilization repressor n=1 Tax=Rhizobium sp. CC-YZS058 TaxID=3042153 RepID=UPI002B0562D8|nr:histidine utilization repressor [Rhizobium sp. CC-YZS058]MEA3536515.1 histidine utilization repressor [Rhizobium sp. CC-YZS058]
MPRMDIEIEDRDLVDGFGLGQNVRNFVLNKINTGEWADGDQIPTETLLARQFGASRMTVHTALRDLAAEGKLVRRRGAGTFVAPRKRQSTFMEIRNIQDEIEERGGSHATEVLTLERVDCDLALATELAVQPGSSVFHSVLLHKENGRPLQLEDRYVNPRFAPRYLEQDFTAITPYQHLMSLGPLDEIEHVIQALRGDDAVRDILDMREEDCLLMMRRRTWSRGLVATSAHLLHPGSRFSLAGRLSLTR